MSPLASFTAPPKKRIAAFVFDSVAVLLVFLMAVALAESQSVDIGSFRVFVMVAAAYHLGFLLLRDGRTLGKQAQDLCVISAAGEPVRAWQGAVRVLVRYLPLALLTVPYVEWELGPAVFGLLIKLVAGLLWLRELALLNIPPARQTLADRAARTLVVNLPAAQPHRAPAVPMFSASDAEFGPAPRRPGKGQEQR